MESSMTVTITRPDNNSPHQFLASAPSPCGRATYSLRFTPDILGAMSLHDFTEMLRAYFAIPHIELSLRDVPTPPDGYLPSGSPPTPGQTPLAPAGHPSLNASAN
jgi:hypothetical protein